MASVSWSPAPAEASDATSVEACLAVGAHVVAGARRRTRLDELRASLRDHERLDVAEVTSPTAMGSRALPAPWPRAAAWTEWFIARARSHAVRWRRHRRQPFGRSSLSTPLAPPCAPGSVAGHGRPAPRIRRRRYRRPRTPGGRAVCDLRSGQGGRHTPRAGLPPSSIKGTGLRVNAILPGIIDTEANRQAMPDANPAHWASPSAIARTALWLLSEESIGTSGALIHQPGF